MPDIFVGILLNAASAGSDPQPDDYEKDGLTWCGKCGTAKSCKVELAGQPYVMPCLCKCRAEELARQEAARQEKARQDAIKANREASGMNPALQRMRFGENPYDPAADKLCRAYVDKWQEMVKRNAGMLLVGNVGTGKTHLAASIANALLDTGRSVVMSTLANLAAEMSRDFGVKREEVLDRVADCSLLILDDVGAERQTDFMRENAYEIVNTRYLSGRPLIVTTNLTPEQLSSNNIQEARLFSRILEACPVKVTVIGQNRRAGIAKDKGADVMRILKGGQV